MPMNNPTQLNKRQAVLTGAMLIAMSGMVSVQTLVAEQSEQHLWLAQLVPSGLIAGMTWALSRLLRRYPGQNLYAIMAGRRWIGKPLVFAYVMFFFYILIRDLRVISEFAGIVLLQNTPVPVISSLIIMTVIIMTRGGLISVGRMVELYGSVIVITVLILPVLLMKDFNWSNIQPMVVRDYTGVAVGSWYLLPYIGQIVILAFLCTNQALTTRTGIVSLGLGTMLILVLAFSCLFVLGDRMIARMAFPNYELVRHIRLTDFMDRLDLVLVGLVMPVMIITQAITLLAVCLGLKQLLPNASGKRLTGYVGFAAFAVSFYFFENYVEVYVFLRVQPWLFVPFCVALPLLFFLLLHPKKRRFR